MKIHQVIIRDNQGKLLQEVKFCNGLLFRQNRSYDIEICFDDFLDRLKTTKQEAKAHAETMVLNYIKYLLQD